MPSMTTVYKRVLGAGKPGDIKAEWPALETVKLICAAGGIAVVAHPLKYKMTLTKLRSFTYETFVELGGQGWR